MKKYYLFLLLFLSYCGLEVPQAIPRLYAPNGVSVENNGYSEVQVTWWGINPEEEFSGYNIYYTDNITDAYSFTGTKILCINFNPKEPTSPVKPPFNVAREFSYNINKYYYSDGSALFTQGKEYWFFVKAYNFNRDLESPASFYASVIFQDSLD